MVRVLLMGRLGNNLFQIAAAASLAKRRGGDFVAVVGPDTWQRRLAVDTLPPYLARFEHTLLRNVRFELTPPEDCVRYREPSFAFAPLPHTDRLLLSGYFQSEKYFDQELVRALFAIDAETERYIRGKYGSLLSRGVTSIHVRRGDYVREPHRFPPMPMSYYRQAMELMGSHEQFAVFSDDLAWCRENFRGDNISFIEGETAEVDLRLQSMCRHHIIANSSFSWWCAWLDPNPNKRVVCPRRWYGPALGHLDLRDLRPAGWTQLASPLPLHAWTQLARHHRRRAATWLKQRVHRALTT